MTQAVAVKSQAKELNTLGELKKAVEATTQRQEIIKEFIQTQLREDVDYGMIKINGKGSKPTLFKPGMEKIFSLFNIVSKLDKDEQTLSMITSKDIIAYKCELYKDGQFLSEGRGACAVSEKGRVNDAIKIAEKRARMDSCLNLGFSEYFTQDLDDTKEDRPVSQERSADQPGQTYDRLAFTVEDKQEMRAQNGNPYARLQTDKGMVIAFKNTMNRFETAKKYFVNGMWEENSRGKAFIVTAPASEVQAIPHTAVAAA